MRKHKKSEEALLNETKSDFYNATQFEAAWYCIIFKPLGKRLMDHNSHPLWKRRVIKDILSWGKLADDDNSRWLIDWWLAPLVCLAPQSLLFSSVLSITLPPFHPSLLFFPPPSPPHLFLSFSSLPLSPHFSPGCSSTSSPQLGRRPWRRADTCIRITSELCRMHFQFDTQTHTVLSPPFVARTLNLFRARYNLSYAHSHLVQGVYGLLCLYIMLVEFSINVIIKYY